MDCPATQHSLALANDADYGFTADVWTKDIDKARTVTRRIQVGQIRVNTTCAGGLELPIGGMTQFGRGREAGNYGTEEYTQVKSVPIEIGKRNHRIG